MKKAVLGGLGCMLALAWASSMFLPIAEAEEGQSVFRGFLVELDVQDGGMRAVISEDFRDPAARTVTVNSHSYPVQLVLVSAFETTRPICVRYGGESRSVVRLRMSDVADGCDI